MQRCAYRFLLVAALGVLPAPNVMATSAGSAPDRELQALKAEAIEIGRELQAIERELRYPGAARTSLHVAVRVSGFLLESVSVRIDGGAPIAHAYSGTEALSLLKDGGWHRLARLRLEPGSHRLQAQFSGRFHDARAGDPPVTGEIEAAFEKGADALDLVLPIARSARGEPAAADFPGPRLVHPARTALLLPPERADAAATGAPDDPRIRAALFLKNDYRHFSALLELTGLRQEAGDELPPTFWWLLAECYLAFGMDTQAAAIHQRLAAGQPDAATLARAQLQLAQFDYQSGRHAEAVERLRAARERLPGALRNDWRVLMTNALLAQQRYADVVALAQDEGLGSATPVLRYNLAVALIRSGKVAEGREQLGKVGTMAVTSLEQLVLRDKANLTLGYQYLQEQQGRAAREAFGRVRTQGPFSNRALLGLGWAEVAQEPAAPAAAAPPAPATAGAADDSLGTLLRTGYAAGGRLDIEGAAAAPSTLPAAEQEALRRALVAWVELVRRDPMDPAVQEGLLAIPWALDRLQAHEQSLTRYLNAIAALEAARRRMDDAIRSVRGNVLINSFLQQDPDSERGWLWKVRALPGVPEIFFLQSLLAEHSFQETLKRLRDARMLGARLEAWRQQLAGLAEGDAARLQVLRARIDALRPRFGRLAAAQDDALEATSIRELEGQRATIERYLTEARFAVARIYDRQAAQGAP